MLFRTEKESIKPQKLFADLYDAMFLSGAVLGFGSSLLFATSLDKISKAMLTTTGVAGLAAYTLNSKATERTRKLDAALSQVQWESTKHLLKEEEDLYRLEAEMVGAARKVNLVMQSDPWQWNHWANQAGVVPNMPPVQELTAQQIDQPVERFQVPESDVITINQSQVDAVISPDNAAQLQQLAQAYPEYVRIDSRWLDELCESSANQDMSKRFNHHFCITGETQSGKSTIAGVIINKISALSGKPSTIIGSDPKDAVTRWLCKFSYLFEGFSKVDNWIQFAFAQATKQKEAYAKDPKGTGEMFFVQDEVDTVYGGGKGFLGFLGANKKIQASQAQSAQSLWNFLIKFMAGAKGHYIGIGQSPLSGDTGLSRPAYKSVCFIALGQTVDYIFEHPADFLRVSKEVQENLNEAAEFMKKAGLRYALVIPMRGNPYIAIIPKFDVDNLQVPTQATDFPQEANKYKTFVEIEEEMMAWIQESEELPSPEEVKAKWESISGKTLKDNQLNAILKGLGLES